MSEAETSAGTAIRHGVLLGVRAEPRAPPPVFTELTAGRVKKYITTLQKAFALLSREPSSDKALRLLREFLSEPRREAALAWADDKFGPARKIITLEQARLEGLSKYFTGIACGRGHVAERKVSNRECLDCKKVDDRLRYKPRPPRPLTPAQAARAAGQTRFFTGIPCKRGHIAPRRSSDGSCVVCKQEDARKGHRNRSKECAAARRRYAENPTPHLSKFRERYAQNPEKERARARRYKEEVSAATKALTDLGIQWTPTTDRPSRDPAALAAIRDFDISVKGE